MILWPLLALQGVLFALWAWHMFRALFRLRRHAVGQSGQAFPGLSASLTAAGWFLRAPETRRERVALCWLTLALLASTIALAALAPALAAR